MTESNGFGGFPKETLTFLSDLKKHNDKVWFKARQADYEEYVMTPSRQFVIELGKLIRKDRRSIIADPRVNRSLFKVYRDTRFAKDKKPFKTNLGLWLWEGTGKRMESPGFYIHIEPPNLILSAGFYIFPKAHLDEYRKSVVHKIHGESLFKALEKTTANKGLAIGGTHYKKTPRGFDSEHKNAALLLHNGIYASYSAKLPTQLHKPEFVAFAYQTFRKMYPLHEWLVKFNKRVGAK